MDTSLEKFSNSMSAPEVYIKIGVFDSGIGGKLIAQKISRALPVVKVIFKSDPQYFPYGNKSPQVIFERLAHFTRLFAAANCSLIVIACNTATTNAINRLRHKFPQVTFVGVEPPLKPIAQLTRTGKVAIMGTLATVASLRYAKLHNQFTSHLTVFNITCLGLAEAIEANPRPRPETAIFLRQFLDQPIAAGVDVVGIACTHYPYLLSQMQSLYPQVTFYDPADAVVVQVLKLTHDSLAKI